MRSLVAVLLTVVVLLMGIPALIIVGWNRLAPPPEQAAENINIHLYVSSTRQVVTISLEEYLKGVLAAEMPADFDLEALKAQAVAARTYAVKRARIFGGQGCDSSPLADVCDNPAHCQAWLPTAELQAKWGMIDYHTYWDKISQAVDATANEIITYQGVAIDPVFHSTCGGETEDAGNVWQKSEPYLVPVKCTYCQDSPKLVTDQSFSLAAFVSAVHGLDGAIAVTAQKISAGAAALTIESKSESGRALQLSVGGKSIKATDLRYALGLNSTRFSFKVEDNQIIFHVIGYGHGVGLCQYGANGMAKAGKTYQEILQFYYQGTMITKLH